MKSAHFASSHSINRRTFLLTAGALALVELSRAQETASERVPEHCLRDVPRHFAGRLCACWRRQFEITDFNAPLNERNRKTFAETVPILCDGLRMCVANGWRPIIVLPPISRHYDEVFKPVFWKTYVSDFVAAANPVKAPYWDYGADPRFRDDSLYANSLMLNRKGRALFTAEIVQRVERSMKT